MRILITGGVRASGELRPPKDIDELPSALATTFKMHHAARRAVGEQARKVVQQDCNCESVAKQLIRLYEWVSESRERPEYVPKN